MVKYTAWTFADIQKAHALLFKMKKDGITTIDDAINKLQDEIYSVAHKSKMAEKKNLYKKQKVKVPDLVCSNCGGHVYLQPVNITACTQTGDDSNTAIMCYNEEKCGHVDYSKLKVHQFPTKWTYAKVDRSKRVRFFDE